MVSILTIYNFRIEIDDDSYNLSDSDVVKALQASDYDLKQNLLALITTYRDMETSEPCMVTYRPCDDDDDQSWRALLISVGFSNRDTGHNNKFELPSEKVNRPLSLSLSLSLTVFPSSPHMPNYFITDSFNVSSRPIVCCI